MRAGIADEEGIEVARLFHGKLPKTDRPSFGDWLTQLRTKPDAAPKALRPYLGAEAAPAAPALPRSNAGTVAQPTGPGAGPTISAEQLREARMHYQRTGDASRMEALQAAMNNKPGRA